MKEKWEQAQLARWRSDVDGITNFFAEYGVDFKATYEQLLDLTYDDIQPVRYLLGKMQKAIGVCKYLDDLAQKNGEDVDKIKLFQLISHAEIAMKVLDGVSSTNNKRVDEYFEPVASKLRYRLRLGIADTNALSKLGEDTSAPSILYKLRCEYAHQGNYLGSLFRTPSSVKGVYKLSSFEWDLKTAKSRELRRVSMETNLTYDEFMHLYFVALKEHVCRYVSARNK